MPEVMPQDRLEQATAQPGAPEPASVCAHPEHVQWLAIHQGTALLEALRAEGIRLDVEAALDTLVAADPDPALRSVPWLCLTYMAGGYRWEDVATGAGSQVAQTLVLFARHRNTLPPGQRHIEDYTSIAALYAAIQPLLRVDAVDTSPQGRARRRQRRAQARAQSIMVHESPELIIAVPTTQSAAQWWGQGTRWCTAAEQDNAFDHYHAQAPLIVVVLPGVALQSPGVALQSPGVALQSPGVALQSPGVALQSPGVALQSPGVALQSPGVALQSDSPLQSQAIAGGGKMQLHMPPREQGSHSGKIQFMDTCDDWVSPDFVDLHWGRLAPLLEWAIECEPSMLRYVPHHRRTREQCLHAAQSLPGELDLISPEWMTSEVCAAAVAANAFAIEHVPEHLRTPKLCMAAVRGSAHVLGYLRNPSREICLVAVQSDGRALRMVPAELKDLEVCREAVGNLGIALRHVPPHVLSHPGFLDEDLCIKAMSNCGHMLNRVPMHLRSRAVCIAAVSDNGAALEHVPLHLVDRVMCVAAVNQQDDEREYHQSTGLRFMPQSMVDLDLCRLAVACNGTAIRYVPVHLVDDDMCRVALGQFSHTIRYVPPAVMTPDLYAYALQCHPDCFEYVDHKFHTVEMCTLAVGLRGRNLVHVRPDLLTPELFEVAIQQDSGVMARLPSHMQEDIYKQMPWLARPPHPWNSQSLQALVRLHSALGGKGTMDLGLVTNPAEPGLQTGVQPWAPS